MAAQSSDLDRYKHPSDPLGLLSDLGIQKLRQHGSKITGVCPFHPNADQEDGFFGLTDKGTYGCGTVRCVEPMDFIALVMKMAQLPFKEALRWIGARCGYGDQDVTGWQRTLRRHVPPPREQTKPEDRITPDVIERAVEEYHAREIRYWNTRPRPLPEWVVDMHEGGLTKRREGQAEFGWVELERAIFPIYNASEKLMGWTGRVTDDSKIRTTAPEPGKPIIPKWRHFPGRDPRHPERYAFEARDHFFGWQFAGDFARMNARAILVEGPGDVLAGADLAEQLGEDWWPLGVFGTTLKEGQAHILRQAGVVELWLIKDRDQEDARGRRAGDNIITSARREMPYATIWLVELPEPFKDLGEVADPAVYRAAVEARRLV